MIPKLLSGGWKIDPRRLENEAKMAPGGLPEAIPRAEPFIVTFFAPFFRLLAGSWGALGRLLARLGAVLAPLGSLLRSPGALLGLIWAPGGALFGDFEPRGASPEPTSRK